MSQINQIQIINLSFGWGSKLLNFKNNLIEICFYICERIVSSLWLRRLYSVEQKKINRVYVRDKRRIKVLISQFQQFY